ncbi:DUF5916 domain-containing protein [Rubrivirga sp. IMCC45206]|uniref:DUF5916 domain-containing protein n=1 Tax=Rubrivirga sp. IMCC45206 TaxID=3391614 RepID=UPI00398FC870
MRTLLPLGLLAILLVPAALAQSAGPTALRVPPTLQTVPLADAPAPRIDGVPDEAVWATAPRATGFVQRTPAPGDPATERTEAAVLYGDDALYVAFWCYVRDPSTLVARLARRDQFVGSDRVAVAFDSYNDDRTAFYFGVTAGNVEQDILMFNDGDEDTSWDAVWEGKSARFESAEGAGYTVEMRIPFSQLRYTTGAGPEVWGIQFQRRMPTTGEDVFWAPILPDANGFVSRFGRLDGLDVQRAPRQIEIVPYALTQLTQAPGDADNPFYQENAFGPNAGFDATIGLSSNLTLTATVNPDFGQVEADPAVVNLSQFENFFEERRPFFVEGVDIFEYGGTRTNNVSFRPTFFYSRRIGRSPTRRLGGGDIAYVDAPDQTPIAAAAKVSGKVGPWSVGLLDAVTLEEDARYLTTDGQELRSPVEPLSNYLVGRVRRDFRAGNTVVGGIVTNASRRMGSDGLFEGITASSATLAGLDFEHRFAERAWAVSGVAATSVVRGSEAFVTRLQTAPQRYYQRPDAGHLSVDPSRTSLAGAHAELSVQRSVEDSWDASLTGAATSPGFDVNDLGFQNRADVASINYFVGRRQSEAPPLRRYSVYHYGGYVSNFDGDLIGHYYGGGAYAQFQNQWSVNLGVNATGPQKNDRLTRGGPIAERPTDAGIRMNVNTDQSRVVSGGLFASVRSEFANEYDGAPAEYDRYVGAEMTVRPSNALSLSIEPTIGWERDNDQFVARIEDPAAALDGTRYVFADIRQVSFDLGVRADWTFTPDLTLQLFAQPFVTTGQYSSLKEFRTPGSFDFDVFGVARGTVAEVLDGEGAVVAFDIDPGDGGAPFQLGNRDFNFRSLRGNAVLRWEWRPGSTLFAVWQQQRSEFAPYDGFGVGEEIGEVFRAPVENVFLLKATYWFGL